MNNKKTTYILHAILLTTSILFIFPIIWMIVNSFKPEAAIISDITSIRTLLPIGELGVKNYFKVLFEYNILKYVGNTLIYAFFAMLIGVVVNGLAGFSLAKLQFPFSDRILNVIILLLILPMETVIISVFLIINNLGLSNSILGYLLPSMASPFFIFMFRQFFLQIEDEIEEAANLDGAGTIRYFFEFVLPMSKPIVATVSVFIFLAVWNDFLWPILIFSDNKMMPIQIGVNALFNNMDVTLGEKLAALTIVTIPVVLVYSFFQQYIVQGVASMGSSKE